MLKISVLGSSSAGNSYLIQTSDSCLVIEAGIPISEVKKELNYKLNKIVAVICTHSHL